MTSQKLVGKVALVTGGSGGIGSGIAKRLAKDGVSVVIGFSQSAEAAAMVVADIIAGGGQALAVQADVANAMDVQALFKAAKDRFGKIDIVINNAGVIIPGLLADITDAAYDKVFGVNVRGALEVLKQAAGQVAEGGRIVSTSSTIVGAPIAGSALYVASKAALEAFSHVLAKEMGAKGVTVNAIRVGPTIPGMFAKAPPERQAALAAASPFKRLGRPEDVADVVAFLVSEDARWMTGQIVTIDGGAF